MTDDGKILVGSILLGNGNTIPAIYQDGEWQLLPLPAGAKNSNEAIAITPDGKTIGGYSFMNDPGSEVGGRYYPIQWVWANEQWELKTFNITLPDHQGFFPLCMSADGRVIAGQVYCGMDSNIECLLVDGEFKIFHELTTRMEPLEYRGKWYCGTDENGKQIWTDDPNDPRIVLFTEYYIDGIHNNGGDTTFNGALCWIDAKGNVYGRRSVASNVQEDGTGDVNTYATIYNLNTGEFADNQQYNLFTCGTGDGLIFTGNGMALENGEEMDIATYYGVTMPSQITGINKISEMAHVVGGVRQELNEAIGEYSYFPMVITTPYAGVQNVYGGDNTAFIVNGRTLSVINADTMSVYDLNGNLISRGACVEVPAGVYLLKAGDKSAKVIVK